MNYINNKEYLKAINESIEKDELTKEMINLLTLHIDELGRVYENNIRYEDIEDMKQYVWIRILHAWRKYNPTISENCFAFFTSVIKRGFLDSLRSNIFWKLEIHKIKDINEKEC